MREITKGVKRYAAKVRRLGTEERFIKHPTTWLNAGCWMDEETPSNGNGHSWSPTLMRMMEAAE